MANPLSLNLSPSPGYGEGGPKDREGSMTIKGSYLTLSVGDADTSPIKGEEKAVLETSS
jgi:hypothetical protein